MNWPLRLPLSAFGLFLILSSSLMSTTARGQANAGSIRGRVTDQKGNAVSSARLEIANPLTLYRQTVESNSMGEYNLIDIPLNGYTLRASAPGFDPYTQAVEVRSSLAQRIEIQLGVSSLRQQVTVSETNYLLQPDKTGPSVIIDRERVRRFTTAQPSRSMEEIIATAPGWVLDANNRLEARGIENHVQYSIDGVPILSTVAPTFANSPDPRIFRSTEISTANIAAEYGNKLAGVVAVNTSSGLEIQNSGDVELSGGRFSTFDGSFNFGGHTSGISKVGYFVSASRSQSGRFFDPPTMENFHNRGGVNKGFLKLDFAPNSNDIFRYNLFGDGARFEVPNILEQEEAGQDQRRSTRSAMQSLSWQHIFSPRTISQLSLFHQYNSAKLHSNEMSEPAFAEQSRRLSSFGVVGSLTRSLRRQTIKAGFELMRWRVNESFTFAVTDLDDLLEQEPDLPPNVRELTIASPFRFNEKKGGGEASFYVQDHINATPNLTFDLGLRFDHYRFLVSANSFSPRLAAAYRFAKTNTVFRAAYNRFMETPSLENLLLSSSARTLIFSPIDEDVKLPIKEKEDDEGDARAPVRPSRESQIDLGFQQQLTRWLRFDADYYFRRISEMPEIVNFLETGIIFPATLARSRAQGLETRVDFAPARGFSGYLSFTNQSLYGFAPLTGGLFLEEAVELFKRSGQRIKIEENQRNIAAFELRYDHRKSYAWVALSSRHNSGYSLEIGPNVTRQNFAEKFNSRILDQVNFERGFVKPRTVFNLSAGKMLAKREHMDAALQFNVENLFNRFYVITFENVFSGSTVGRPRTASVRLRLSFK